MSSLYDLTNEALALQEMLESGLIKAALHD